jgi:hypothetical protein
MQREINAEIMEFHISHMIQWLLNYTHSIDGIRIETAARRYEYPNCKKKM